MDTPATDRFALMSIKPQFARAILDGTKGIEFRKRRLAADIDTVIIYATLPLGMVIGAFQVVTYDVDHPSPLWERHKKHAGITRSAYRDYYRNTQHAVGIVVEQVVTLPDPVPLSQLRPGVRAPQSFAYLSWDDVCPDLKETVVPSIWEDPVVSTDLSMAGAMP
jgi:predicted transcriptional regulator